MRKNAEKIKIENISNFYITILYLILLIIPIILFSIKINSYSDYKNYIVIYSTFLVGDITLITLLFGVFAPLIKADANKTPWNYQEIIKRRIYDKRILISLAFLITFHTLNIIISNYYNGLIIFLYFIIITTVSYMSILFFIWFIFRNSKYEIIIFKKIKTFEKMANKDYIKEKLSKYRKAKYNKLVSEIISIIPSEKEHINYLGPYLMQIYIKLISLGLIKYLQDYLMSQETIYN